MAHPALQAPSNDALRRAGFLRGAMAGRRRSAMRSAAAAPLRIALLLGCALAVVVALRVADPTAHLQADPALARLLRGMAVIKGSIAMAAVGAVFWRMAWPLSAVAAGSYLGCCWLMAGAAMLVWQLSYIPAAALLFDAAALTMLVVSWRER